MKEIDQFRGQYRWLSNFWLCPVQYEDRMYPSSEHAFQAAKYKEDEHRKAIVKLPRAGDAKKYSWQHRLPEDRRQWWEEHKIEIMEEILWDKFIRNKDLQAKLVETDDAMLIEGNSWNDTFWGVCNGKGRNELGKLLMKIRGEM